MFSAFRSLLYSATVEQYNTRLQHFARVCPKDFYQYCATNWFPCVEMWAFYARKSVRALGNNTTNRVEALNRAIKALFRSVQRTCMKASEAVSTLLRFLVMADTASLYSDFLNATKMTYVNNPRFGLLIEEAANAFTENAVRLLLVQLTKLEAEGNRYSVIPLGDDNWAVTNTLTEAIYTLQAEPADQSTGAGVDESRIVCSCFFSCGFGLPCRHVMHIRHSMSSVHIYVHDAIGRWLRTYNGVDPEFLRSALIVHASAQVLNDDVNDFVDTDVFSKPALPREARYNAALSLAKEICSIAATYAGTRFNAYLDVLRKVKSACEAGVPGERIIVTAQLTEPGQANAECQTTISPSVAVVTVPSTEAESLSTRSKHAPFSADTFDIEPRNLDYIPERSVNAPADINPGEV